MKLISHTLVILALYALSSSASQATSPANMSEKRAEKCKIHGNLARCRRRASLSATIFGEFAAGTGYLTSFFEEKKKQREGSNNCRPTPFLAGP
jgi:hypothetical protein